MVGGSLRAAEVAAPRAAFPVDRTVVVWGGVTLLAGLLLPWTREQRELWSFSGGATGAALAARHLGVAASLLLAAAAIVAAVLPLPRFRRGQVVLALSGLGAVITFLSIWFQKVPLGLGALIVFLGYLTLAGSGISLSGLVHADPFTGATILWVAGFVVVFILLPLGEVLLASVFVRGRFTLDVLLETVRSPGFLLLNNPATPANELAQAGRIGLAGGILLAVLAVIRARRARPVLLWGVGGGAGVFVLAALYYGFGAVRNSVLLALVVGAGSTALGFLFALLGERSRLPTRRLLGPLSILPIITPPFVLGLAMIYLFGRRGFVTHQLLGLDTTIFFGPVGVAVAQILAFTPIAYLVLQGVVQALDMAMEEAAETLGASRWHVLRTVTWPLTRPGIANAFLLVAIESLADFGNPFVVGGGQPFLATQVFDAFSGRFNPNEAAVYGVTLLVMTLVVFFLQQRWIGRRGYVTVTGKPGAGALRPLPTTLDYVGTGVFLFWVVLTVALYGSVFSGSVTVLWGFDYTLTLEHLRGLRGQGMQVFQTSIMLSAVAAFPSMILGFLIAYLVTRVEFPGRSALEFGSMLSFAVPGTVMGIGYVLAFNDGPLLLTGTSIIITMAFVFRNMPVGIRAGVAAIHQLDRAIEEASTMLGAGTATTMRRIIMPLIVPALLSGLVFAFVRAVTAVSQVIFLVTPRHNLATTQILSYVQYGTLGRGAALASLLILAMAAVVLVLYLLSHRLSPRVVRQAAA
ncbi:MAG: ABC transporter permease, iron(III) transport system permease protein [Armatimonadetes bacterium CSP1-3]|nr:MAG: ABC transporter permease, iron(III) transport system permease protein [Armatimonadetes bacterium CSP1-3]